MLLMFCVLKMKKRISTYALTLLMIRNKERWHYIVVKKLLTLLLKGIKPKDNGDYYCLNCLHLFKTNKQTRKGMSK